MIRIPAAVTSPPAVGVPPAWGTWAGGPDPPPAGKGTTMRAMAWLLRVLSGIGLLSLLFVAPAPGQAQTTSTTFPQTGHTVSDPFLSYWQAHGGLAQFGYPISDVLSEVSPLDGHSYQVQYFQRAEFELHPENAAPYNVLLTQLGTLRYKALYPNGAPGQQASTDNAVAFPETGHSLGGLFRTYWEQHGGLAVQGYPISDEFTEVSPLDGKLYTVQYFERAVFELHPENAAPYNVLLTQLGTLRYQAQYGGGAPPPGPPTSPAAPTATPLPIPGGTPLPQVPPGVSTDCSGIPASQNADRRPRPAGRRRPSSSSPAPASSRAKPSRSGSPGPTGTCKRPASR